ncbi:hypothetical protein ACIBQ6_21970 [Nonomuraea sp. NPDC049655]|uniref:hypothetical protein n=1 Tax=Nonomuraea sp. NPDC049655 TaxID=3364355 RepID=UPI00379B8278
MTSPEIDWPYDADQNDPLTKLRIAVVGHAWPRWFYIVAFDSGRLDDEQHRPDEHETLLLRSFLDEYIEHWYNDRWKAKMAERPFDIDGGANGVIFRKWSDNDWGYRRQSWQYGPTYVPVHPRVRDGSGPGPLTLVQVMDRIHTIGDKLMPHWVEWKAARPEVFGKVARG